MTCPQSPKARHPFAEKDPNHVGIPFNQLSILHYCNPPFWYTTQLPRRKSTTTAGLVASFRCNDVRQPIPLFSCILRSYCTRTFAGRGPLVVNARHNVRMIWTKAPSLERSCANDSDSLRMTHALRTVALSCMQLTQPYIGGVQLTIPVHRATTKAAPHSLIRVWIEYLSERHHC